MCTKLVTMRNTQDTLGGFAHLISIRWCLPLTVVYLVKEARVHVVEHSVFLFPLPAPCFTLPEQVVALLVRDPITWDTTIALEMPLVKRCHVTHIVFVIG